MQPILRLSPKSFSISDFMTSSASSPMELSPLKRNLFWISAMLNSPPLPLYLMVKLLRSPPASICTSLPSSETSHILTSISSAVRIGSTAFPLVIPPSARQFFIKCKYQKIVFRHSVMY